MTGEVEHYHPAPAPVQAPSRHITVRDIQLIEMQAAILAKSSVIALTNPADIALIGMKALALGVEPLAAFDDLYVIESRNPKTGEVKKGITISARMRVALARRAHCEVWFDESDDQRATCCLRRPGERRVHRLTYTIGQAVKVGLADKKNWSGHPAAMLRAAAARQLVNMAAQDVLLGIGGMGDIDLDTDVDDMELPDDIDHTDHPPTVEDAPVVLASDTDRERLIARIQALHPEATGWLRDQAKTRGLPNIRGPHMQAGHVHEYDALIDQAANVAETVPDTTDPERPFE